MYELSWTGSAYVFASIHDFTGADGGAYPTSEVLVEPSGVLYGTAGNVYKLVPNGSTYTFAIVFEFPNGEPETGFDPRGGLIEDSSGALYGTTYYGGTGKACRQRCGVVYKIIQ